MNAEIKIGSVVRLKGGSTTMTVSKRNGEDNVCVMWFDGTTLYEDSFPLAQVELVRAVG